MGGINVYVDTILGHIYILTQITVRISVMKKGNIKMSEDYLLMPVEPPFDLKIYKVLERIAVSLEKLNITLETIQETLAECGAKTERKTE